MPEDPVDLTFLAELDRPGLVRLWKELFGTAVPKSLSRSLACRYLAFELQSRSLGGLPPGFQKRLAALAVPDGTPPAPRLKPGGRYLREWGGVTHVVEVEDGHYLWQGKPWPSLTAIAREITGAHWSGPRFFGLAATKSQGSKPRSTKPPSRSAGAQAMKPGHKHRTSRVQA
jgi:hypothetical protein